MSIARLDDGIRESHWETRRQHLHLHLQLRSGQLRNGKSVGAHGNLHHLRNGGVFGFRASTDQELHYIFVRLKRVCHLVRTCLTLLLLSRLPCTTSTSSSSLTLPSTTTPKHALQSGRHDLLQEHPAHHQPLQARRSKSIAIKNHSLWRENQQSDGNPRNTYSTYSTFYGGCRASFMWWISHEKLEFDVHMRRVWVPHWISPKGGRSRFEASWLRGLSLPLLCTGSLA